MSEHNPWPSCQLEDIAEVNPEGLGPATDPTMRFRYIDLSAVSRGAISWQDVIETDFAHAPSRARRRVQEGDVLFGTVRPALQSHAAVSEYEGSQLVASTGFSVIRAKSTTEPRYLAHVILSEPILAQSRRAEVGSNYPAVNEADVKKFHVPVPPLCDQRRIADILDEADNAIRLSEILVAKLKGLRQGVLHLLVTRGVDKRGILRDPLVGDNQFVDSPLGLIPKEWDLRSLGEVLLDIEQGWSPDCPEIPASVGQWGVLKTSAVVWEGYLDRANKALPLSVPARPEYEIRADDVLMTRAGPNSRVGVVAIVHQTQGQLMLSDKLYRLVPSQSILPAFLAIALSGAPIQRHLSRLKTGLAESQTNISQEIVRGLPIAVPSIQEQALIVERLSAVDRDAEAEYGALDKLRLLKRGLRDDLLTGRVRVDLDGDAA